MSEPAGRARVWLVTAIMVAFIVYGSLYPFDFRVPPNGPGALAVLLGSWNARPGRGDFIANVLLYLPLGFFALPGFRRGTGLVGAVFAGALLSLSMELTQYYDAGRDTEATDFYANTLGAFLGGLAALAVGARFRSPLAGEAFGRPIPVLLIVAWLAYRLYPYVPTINLHKYIGALRPVFVHPSLTAYDLFRQSAIWLTLFALIGAIVRGRLSIHLVLVFAAVVLCAKVTIINTELRMAEVAGVGVAFAVWLCLVMCSPRVRAGIAGGVLYVYVTTSRLEPFQFQSVSGPFGWIPFRSLMYGSVVVDTLSFLEKFFLYGSLLYLLGIASARRLPVTVFVAALLLTTSGMETFLPGRSAEITDALLVVVIAAIFALLPPETGTVTDPRP
jgi:VanZ family protein